MRVFHWILILFICLQTTFYTFATDKLLNDGKNIDNKPLSKIEYSLMNLSAMDALGRKIEPMSRKFDKEKHVGLFYMLWLGQHSESQHGIYNVQHLLNNDISSLQNPKGTPSSPTGEYHFWGEPLYGYYTMSDPWVITRHIELLTYAGIDYLCIDATNAFIYRSVAEKLLNILQKFQMQGFDVPKVVFYTNAHSGKTVDAIYKQFYEDDKYKSIWYSPNGKPMIMGITEHNNKASDMTKYNDRYSDFISPAMQQYFDVRESQWPNGNYNEEAIPWMSWQYPQWNHNGNVAVPVIQHSHSLVFSSSLHPECSRAYNNVTKQVEKDWTAGTNFQTMWNAVFASEKEINNVFVTAFNEWMAIKIVDETMNEGNPFFVDVYNHEFSRDIEMMKGGYNDNYYLQLVQNLRKFKYEKGQYKQLKHHTIDIDVATEKIWDKVNTTYVDFEGDAIPRNFSNAVGTDVYVDNSNRNDITEIKVTHDKDNIYFRIKTLEDISKYNGTDVNWMNILIRSGEQESFEGYQYIINRTPKTRGESSVEKSLGGYNWTNNGTAKYNVRGNIMQISIPISSVGMSVDNCQFEFKVADNVTKFDDIMDYYVSGDSAPIGRLNYSYGK